MDSAVDRNGKWCENLNYKKTVSFATHSMQCTELMQCCFAVHAVGLQLFKSVLKFAHQHEADTKCLKMRHLKTTRKTTLDSKQGLFTTWGSGSLSIMHSVHLFRECSCQCNQTFVLHELVFTQTEPALTC